MGISLPYALQGQIIGFVIFMIAALAELVRIPFDMPIAESELVMGYLTEYSGIRFTMFLLGEYAGMLAMSAHRLGPLPRRLPLLGPERRLVRPVRAPGQGAGPGAS